MTDRAQFEAMLEALINDDQAQAKEIFHNIVVGKSREIYEELLAEDFSQDAGNPYKKESSEDEMEEDDEMSPMEEESEEDDADDSEDDADDSEDDADDSEDDGEENPFGDEEGGEGDEDLEDRVMDLEDALEDLKAEFEQLLAGEEHEEENEPGIHGDDMNNMGDMGDADMGMDTEVDELAGLMEYVDKVAAPKHGDNGTNTKSLVDNMKNDMGGTTANIAQNHVEVSGDVGAKSTVQGNGVMKPNVVPNPDAKGNINVPGGKAGKTGFKTQVKGGGIDRQAGFNKPGPQVGATDSSGKGESNTRSSLNARK
jgi:hypothetical protein